LPAGGEALVQRNRLPPGSGHHGHKHRPLYHWSAVWAIRTPLGFGI